MKALMAIAAITAFSFPFALPLDARAAYETAGCAQNVEAPTRQEDQAKNEQDADDYGAAYYDYQQAAIYRANCADETTGKARQWNTFIEAMDYFGLAVAAMGSELWRDKAMDYRAKAHQLANALLSESLGPTLQHLVEGLWNDTQ